MSGSSFERFSPIHQAFLDQLVESIGIVLNTIEANTRTEDLLKQSQSLAKELQSRQEELQNTNEELQEKAKLLADQNSEVERKNTEVEQARQALEARQKLYPPERHPQGHPDLAASLTNLGSLYQAQRNFAQAQSHLEQALA